jgi:hypothetical protein
MMHDEIEALKTAVQQAIRNGASPEAMAPLHAFIIDRMAAGIMPPSADVAPEGAGRE